jgi:3',5'-cyclic AMP phosphodiesterase CpdA
VSPRVVVVSDSHFSARTPEAEANWDAVVRHVGALRPDLVIHIGDVSVDGANEPDELRLAREQLDRLPVGWLAVPGNHDVGDNPGDTASEYDVTRERLVRWSEAFGSDRWSADLGDWRLVGVNAQLFGTGGPEEGEQWDFLEDSLGEPRRTVLVTHKPLTAGAEELATAPSYRFVPSPARSRLTALCRHGGVEAVLSGHVHQHRQLEADGMTHLWATTTWAVIPDELQPVIGAKRCGILELGLPGAGAAAVPAWVEPAGMAQLTLGRDIPSPYEPIDGDTTT